MTSNNQTDLEPIEPHRAQELYLEHKATECTEQTVQSHRYRTNHLIEWLYSKDIENMNELSGRDLHEFRLWRANEADINNVTMQTQLTTIRVFLKWLASIEAIPPELPTKLLIPTVSKEEIQKDDFLEAEHAKAVIEHLSKFQYASRKHALFGLLWETGMRIGEAQSIDLQDINQENLCIELVHRPDNETTLKNGRGGERLVAISPELASLLEDFIRHNRKDVSDPNGRDALFSGINGRLSRSSMRRIAYDVTAPCFLNRACPDCCRKSESKCPESVSPHAIRRGAITHLLTQDIPVEVVGDHMDVSRSVLLAHYDERQEEVKLEQRRDFLRQV